MAVDFFQDATEPSRGVFTFAAGDAIVAQAREHGQIMRGNHIPSTFLSTVLILTVQGHNCVWHNQLPDWVTADNFDNATMLSVVKNHCGTLVGHYKGKM